VSCVPCFLGKLHEDEVKQGINGQSRRFERHYNGGVEGRAQDVGGRRGGSMTEMEAFYEIEKPVDEGTTGKRKMSH
jgi:hypothetical protein